MNLERTLIASIPMKLAIIAQAGPKLPTLRFFTCNFFILVLSILFSSSSDFLKQFTHALLNGIIVCPNNDKCKLYPPPIICGILCCIQNCPTIRDVSSTVGLSAQLMIKSASSIEFQNKLSLSINS